MELSKVEDMSPEAEMNKLHQQALQDIFSRPISQEELYYLVGLYPYIVICDKDNAVILPDEVPERIRTENGWTILIYTHAVVLGTNYIEAELYQKLHKLEGLGTLSNQMLHAVEELIQLIKKRKKWDVMQIIAGHYPVQRMAWIICTIFGYPVVGFDPKVEDEVVRLWVEKLRKRILFPPTYSW